MSLDNIQIQQICKHYNVPLVGVYMRDQLATPRIGFYVINMQPASWQGDGSHWVCCIIGQRDSIYFDSFGGTPPRDVLDFLRRYEPGRKIATNAWIVQDINSERCGWFCIGLAIFCKKHPGAFLADIMNDYVNRFVDNTRLNGGILLKMFTNEFGKTHALVRSVLAKNK